MGKLLDPWTRISCADCGSEFLATRAEPAEVSEDARCPECAGYTRGFADGVASADAQTPVLFALPRLNWDVHFMLLAHFWATRATCNRGPELFLAPGRHGVGAVLVREKRVLASGYNGSPPGEPHCDERVCPVCGYKAQDLQMVTCPDCYAEGDEVSLVGGHIMRDGHCVRTLHAEENLLLQCALDGVSPHGATVYTSASPCWDCSKRLARVGISELVFAEEYGSRYGLSGDAKALLERAGISVRALDVRAVLPGVGGGV